MPVPVQMPLDYGMGRPGRDRTPPRVGGPCLPLGGVRGAGGEIRGGEEEAKPAREAEEAGGTQAVDGKTAGLREKALANDIISRRDSPPAVLVHYMVNSATPSLHSSIQLFRNSMGVR